jgi:hypothetical protein
MTIPFGSGGSITASQTLPSINVVLGPGVNGKFQATVDQSERSAALSASITTPLGGGKGSLKNSGKLDYDLTGPRLNLPLGFGANAYFGIEWE